MSHQAECAEASGRAPRISSAARVGSAFLQVLKGKKTKDPNGTWTHYQRCRNADNASLRIMVKMPPVARRETTF